MSNRRTNHDGTPRAIRRDDRLKRLPAAQRAQVIDWHLQDGEESCRQRILSELGISGPQGKPIGMTTFYEALAYWRSEEKFRQYQSVAASQAQLEAEAKGGMTTAEMEEAVDRNFIMLASAQGDVDAYRELRLLRIADQAAKTKGRHDAEKIALAERKLMQAEERLQLDLQKFRWDAAKEVLANLPALRSIERDRGLSTDEKIAAVQLKLFGPVPAEFADKFKPGTTA